MTSRLPASSPNYSTSNAWFPTVACDANMRTPCFTLTAGPEITDPNESLASRAGIIAGNSIFSRKFCIAWFSNNLLMLYCRRCHHLSEKSGCQIHCWFANPTNPLASLAKNITPATAYARPHS